LTCLGVAGVCGGKEEKRGAKQEAMFAYAPDSDRSFRKSIKIIIRREGGVGK